ncbi:MAG TPA: 2Fe-2S iron-sulfur cluster-binding protein [Chryseolinea sp.]|nr:2Fe-2S iron-sulfur cluster-binding protein [Chryseolinea sp.]HPM29227.1 2Fe-2S iron-sulfur cluster-binding protein [Chryseolinea sp.]
MAKIIIQNLHNTEIDIRYFSKPALVQFGLHSLDWMQDCGGKGRCVTCRFKIIDGMDNFTPLTPAEERYRKQNLLQENERLACQAIVLDDVVISVPEDCKLKHLQYT